MCAQGAEPPGGIMERQHGLTSSIACTGKEAAQEQLYVQLKATWNDIIMPAELSLL